jgi:predicted hotdog family 3-hydroxylacyl-ACP dehydratase
VSLGKAEIAALIPHAGRMCLIDRVDAWTEDRISCVSMSHREPDHPLAQGGLLPVLAGVEYAGQAMALQARLSAPKRQKPRAGLLASLRELTWSVTRLDDIAAPLLIEAEKLAGDGATALYSFHLSALGRSLLQGRAAVLLSGGTA